MISTISCIYACNIFAAGRAKCPLKKKKVIPRKLLICMELNASIQPAFQQAKLEGFTRKL